MNYESGLDDGAHRRSGLRRRVRARVRRRAAPRRALYAKLVNDALEAAPALATGFNAQSALATQLKTVAKMIAVRDRLDMSRQVFFVGVGGYDTHDRERVDREQADRADPAEETEYQQHGEHELTRRARYRPPRRVVGGPQPVVSGLRVPGPPFLDGPAAGRV